MNWHEELQKRGFQFLCSSTRTYGYNNGKLLFTGSIEIERKNKITIITPDDKIQESDKEVFCPFIHGDDERKPNINYQTVRIRNTEELDNYLYN